MPEQTKFKPFVSAETKMAELTVKSIVAGALFGIIFGASTVYLALKAGLTVSASISHCSIGHYTRQKIFKDYNS